MSIRIVIADEHRLTGEAVAATLNQIQDFAVVGLASVSTDVVPTVVRTAAAVVILDAGMAGRTEMSIPAQLRDRVPTCGIALVAVSPSRALVDRAVAAGALSIVPKHARLAHLVDAVRGVAAGCLTIDPTLLWLPRAGGLTLADREREILRLTAAGASIKEIAEKLFLAPGTVRNLTSKAIKKLDARNRFDAARIADQRGMI